MKSLTTAVLFLITMLVMGCAPSQAAIEKAISMTETAKPSATTLPTNTLLPTSTLVPTSTNTPRPTRTNTKTPTKIPTLTPRPTNTSGPTRTPTPTTPPYWQTQTAVAIRKSTLEKYEQVNNKEFATYPDNYKSKFIKVGCNVFNVISNEQFQCWIPSTNDAFFVISVDKFNDIYENDRLTLYGMGAGEHCGTNAFGGSVCQPIMVMAVYEKR